MCHKASIIIYNVVQYHIDHCITGSLSECIHLSNADTTACTLSVLRSLQVCPVPTNTIGCPVV